MEHLSSSAVVSHVSAALVHGLPVWGVALDRVTVTRARRSGGRSGSRVHVHVASLDPAEIEVVGGIAVTSVARTVADVARTVGFEQAVVVADAALAAKLVDRRALDAVLDRMPRWPGVPAARRALAFADAGGTNPAESRSRVAIAKAGLPVPVLQWDVRSAGGRFVGRVDFGWPGLRAVGEFDGRIKYGRLQDAAEAVYQEKLREDALRAEDLGVTRWGWDALADFTQTADRLRRSYRRC